MKKLIAIAGAIALTACGGSDEPAAVDDTPVMAPAMNDTVAGTYEYAGPDGGQMAMAFDANGTISETMNGEVVRSGTWEGEMDNVCITYEAALGEDAAEPQCYAMTNEADGRILVTAEDGTALPVTKAQ